MAQSIGGTCYLKINGALYPVRGNWTYSVAKTKKSGVAGQDGVHGNTEMPRVPYIKGDISDFGQLSVTDLQGATITIATLELKNGKVIIGNDGWVADEQEVNTEEGKYELKLEFIDAFEQISA